MNNDLVVRLLLKTNGFDADLGKAKKSTEDFASQIGGKATAAIGKFAAGIGLAMGGAEAFNRVLRSSQTLSDTFDNTMNALKGTVDAFFQSISSGNWDAFNGGLMQAISNMHKVSSMQDMLADAKLTMNFDIKQMESEFARLESIISDKSKTKAERVAAEAELQKQLADFRQRVELTAQGAAKTLMGELKARLGQDFSLEDVNTFFRDVNNEFLNTETLQRLNQYKSDLAEMQKNLYVSSGGGTFGSIGGVNKAVEAQIAAFKSQNAELEKMRLLQDDMDLKRTQAFQDYEYILDLQKKAGEYDKRSLESQTKIAELNKVSGGKATGKKGLQMPVVVSQVQYDTDLGKKVLDWMNGKEVPVIKAEIEIEGEDIDEEDLSGKWGEHLKSIEDMNSELSSTGEIFGSLGGVMASFGNDMGAWMMQSLGNVAQMIVQLQSLATANGVASASKLPFPANIAGIATVVATIASIFSSLPKFAEGGIVGGSSYFGDKLLARVNSGEAVLTQSQQARALALMDGGSNVRVSGDVRLSGKDIYISLRNYMATSGNKL